MGRRKGYVHSPETREKISEGHKGQIPWNKGLKDCYSEDMLKQMSESHKGERPYRRGKTGRKASDETKEKMSKSRMGRIVTEETREKIRKALTGKKLSDSHRESLSKSHMGNKHTDETKKKMSILNKKRYKENKTFLANLAKSMAAKPNKKETQLIKFLQHIIPNEYKFTGDYSFWIDGKNPDFLNINGQKKLIELFGEYWHYTKPKKENLNLTKKEVEDIRVNHFKDWGFNTLIIWEDELKNEETLKQKILDFHRGE